MLYIFVQHLKRGKSCWLRSTNVSCSYAFSAAEGAGSRKSLHAQQDVNPNRFHETDAFNDKCTLLEIT